MVGLLKWCVADLKRGLVDLDANKLMMVPFAYFVALAVLDFSVENWCQKWPHSLRCSKEAVVSQEAPAGTRKLEEPAPAR
jgi:hypothetical protein